jgi:hypothetical protein
MPEPLMDWTSRTATCFAGDYAAARRGFLGIAARYGAPVRSYANPLKGPTGEELATDTIWLGPKDATRVMVLTSATHGIEGFCGSGCQIDWLLEGGPARLPDGVAALLVHAVNPYGFAWLRRVTEENIDLNRNGIDFAQPPPENAGYAELKDAFSPRELKGPIFAKAEAALAAWREKHGEVALRRARTAGQYIDPAGIYYGGTGPAWARRTLETIIADNGLAKRDQVAVIDYHTGLGRYGYGEPICGSRPGEPGQARARLWYGPSLTEPMLGTSTSVVIPGLTQYIWLREVGAERITFIALEYGTYPTSEVEAAVVEENWLHAHGKPDWGSEETRAIKAGLRRVFYPDTDDWKEMVLDRSRQVIRQTLGGLAGA